MKTNRIILVSMIMLLLIACLGCQNETMDSNEAQWEEISFPLAAEDIKSIAAWYQANNQTLKYYEAEDINAFVDVLKQISLDDIVQVSDMPPRYPGWSLDICLEDNAVYKMIIHGENALAIEHLNEETESQEWVYYTVNCRDLIDLLNYKIMEQYAIEVLPDDTIETIVDNFACVTYAEYLRTGCNKSRVIVAYRAIDWYIDEINADQTVVAGWLEYAFKPKWDVTWEDAVEGTGEYDGMLIRKIPFILERQGDTIWVCTKHGESM